ncbi:MAG: FAD:protein FMN transferase [bacterium]
MVLISLLVACSKKEDIQSFSFQGMGTFLQVIYTGEKDSLLEEAVKKDAGLLERELSYYKPESFVSILNREGHLREVEVPMHVCELIEKALFYGKMSDGVFDIAYKSSGILWDKGVVPEEDELLKKAKLLNFESVIADCTKSSIKFVAEGVKIDLGGIAKGYAIDRAGDIIKKSGKDNFIVNYGGDMLICGKKGKKPWAVGIRNPEKPSEVLKTLYFDSENCTGVATSGDYERFFVIEEIKYSHIFDPRTGHPVKDAKSVTVTAKNALIADVAATAISVAYSENELVKKIMEKFEVKLYTLSGSNFKWVEY